MRLSQWSGIVLAMALATQAHAGKEVGDYRGLPGDLAAAATAYDLAQYTSDRAELERLLADDYTLAGSNGHNQTKAEFIDDSTAPGSKTTSIAISDQVSKVWPNGAVLGGIFEAKGTDRGKPYAVRGRFVDVWAKRDGRWQVIFTQAHKVP